MEVSINKTPKQKAREAVNIIITWLIDEIASFEECMYVKAQKSKFKKLTVEQLRDSKETASHIINWGRLLIENVRKSFTTDDEDDLTLTRFNTLNTASKVSGYNPPCILRIMQIFLLEVSGEMNRQKLDISNDDAYVESIKRQLTAIGRDEIFLDNLAESSVHDCCLKTPENCARHFSPGIMKAHRDKRWLIKKLKTFQIRNSILKQHCKLPLTDFSNYGCHIFPQHAKLLEEDLTGRKPSPNTVRLVILIMNAQTLIEHALYVRVSTIYTKKLSYSYLLDHVLKNVNKYYELYTHGNKCIAYNQIKLSRYNLDLIEETEPVFEDGEILWVSHVKPNAESAWFVVPHCNSVSDEIFDKGLCWWCFKRIGFPCERCGKMNFCSDNCREMASPSHLNYCLKQPRLPRSERQILEQAKQILQSFSRSLFTAVFTYEGDIIKSKRIKTDKEIVEYHTIIANLTYDELVKSKRLTAPCEKISILDPYNHYDPVCLIFRLTRMSIRFHRQVCNDNLDFSGNSICDKNIAELARIWTNDFLLEEMRLLAHDCVNNSKVQTMPEKYGKRFVPEMFDGKHSIHMPINLPFTGLDPQYKRIAYDFSGSKCDKIAEELALGMNPECQSGKLIWILLLDSELVVRSSHSMFIEPMKLHNLRHLEEEILAMLKRMDRDDPSHIKDFLQIRLSRFNLQLITDEAFTIDDGEVFLINHIYYYSQWLNSKMWRVMIHDTTLDLADKTLCQWCYTKPGKACSACKKMLYCSAECQNMHWANHRFSCIGGDDIVRYENDSAGLWL